MKLVPEKRIDFENYNSIDISVPSMVFSFYDNSRDEIHENSRIHLDRLQSKYIYKLQGS
jgi:hypothetical protein